MTTNTTLIPVHVGEPLLVGACFMDSRYLVTASQTIDMSWFRDPMYGSMYDNIAMFMQEHGKMPTKDTIISMLGMEFTGSDLVTATDKFEKAVVMSYNVDAEFLEKTARNYIIQQGHWRYAVEISKKLSDSAEISRLGMKMAEIAAFSFDIDIGFDYFEDLTEHMVEIKKDFDRIGTGYSTYDTNFGGGLYQNARCFALFMGQVHMGKSLFLGNIAARMVKNGKFILLVSLEMDAHIYGKRFDSMFAKMDIHTLKHNVEELTQRIISVKTSSSDGKLIIKEYGEGTLSPMMLSQFIQTVERKYKRKVDCVFIDYLNLMVPNPNSDFRSDNSYAIVGAIARQVRNLSRIHKLPIVSATQANRGGFGNTAIDMQHVSESIDLPGIVDVMWSIYRDDDDKTNNIIRTRYLKDRLGGKQGHEDIFYFDPCTLEVLELKEAQIQNTQLTIENKLVAGITAATEKFRNPIDRTTDNENDELITENL